MRRFVVITALLLAACAGSSVSVRPVISGACTRAFRATLDAWEAKFRRVPSECVYLDTIYTIQIVESANEMPCPAESSSERVLACVIPTEQAIYLLDDDDAVQLTNSAVHEWTHVIVECVFKDVDRDHMRAGLWAPYGAGSVEIQAQSSAVPGECM